MKSGTPSHIGCHVLFSSYSHESEIESTMNLVDHRDQSGHVCVNVLLMCVCRYEIKKHT